MQDQISATEMFLLAFKKIHEIEPEHELVKIMSEASDKEFEKRFWDKEEPTSKFPGSMVSMRLEVNYFLAVKKYLLEKYGIKI